MSRIATIWNADKIKFLIENYAHASNLKLANTLGVSIPYVKIKARELGLKKECAKRKIFPSLEANILRMSEICSYRTIAGKLNISVSSVHCAINDAATKGFQKRSREKLYIVKTIYRQNNLSIKLSIDTSTSRFVELSNYR